MNINKVYLFLFFLTYISACTNNLVQPNNTLSLATQVAINEDYQKQIIVDANLAANAQQWAQAFSLLQSEIGKNPNSTLLLQALSNLRQRQAKQLAKLEKERLIAKGEWAIKDLEIRQLTENASSDNWFSAISIPLATSHNKNEELANQLAELGKLCLKQGKLDDAARAIGLARALSPSNEIKKLYENLLIKINVQKQQKLPVETSKTTQADSETQKTFIDLQENIQAPPVAIKPIDKTPFRSASADTQVTSEKEKYLLIEFKKAIKKGQITEAGKLLEKLQKLEIDKITLASLKQQIDQHVSGKVKNLIETGVSFYSQQHYSEALNVWRQAQAIDPTNAQLVAHIERVNKVLDKLHNLRRKQSKTPEKE